MKHQEHETMSEAHWEQVSDNTTVTYTQMLHMNFCLLFNNANLFVQLINQFIINQPINQFIS